MNRSAMRTVILACLAVVLLVIATGTPGAKASDPPKPVKLAFIHHSVGQNWLDDDQGGLARELQAHGYYVSDTNYGWGPDAIGDRTDIPDWPQWFTGPSSASYLSALYALDEVNSPYARTVADPGGENQIIMFKSCYPNSSLSGAPADLPDPEPGLSVGHAKYVYNTLLTYFASRPGTLFVVVTAPPNSDSSTAANARAFNTWLIEDWLDGYAGSNVAVFDFYNVLTGPDNHHRLVSGAVEHVHVPGMDSAYYRSSPGDDHPNVEGSRKATAEFVPLLDYFYSRWTAPAPTDSPSPSVPPTTPSPSVPPTSPGPTASPTQPNPTPTTVRPPGRVQGVHARVKGKRIIVKWTGPAADGYLVQVRWQGKAWRAAAQVGAERRRLVWRAPRRDTAYRLRVAATNSAGRGPFSAVARAVVRD